MSLLLLGTKRFYDVRRLPTRTCCSRCQNLVTYRFVRTRRWLTYFFIPVLPLSTTDELLCPVCEHSIALTAGEARAARRGQLTLTSYDADNRPEQ